MVSGAVLKKYIALIFLFVFTGCSSLFFHPQKNMVLNPELFEIDYKVISKKVDNDTLFGWYLKTKDDKKGTVVFFHGNGGNISYQLFEAFWLVWYGYDVITFDYRGYGNSTGEPSIENIHQDVKAVFDWSIEHSSKDEKLYIFAQSLGGAVAITALADYKDQSRFSKVVIDSAFASYKGVADDVLNKSWFTSLFSALSNTVENEKLDPINNIANIDIPIVLIHGKKDTVVDFTHSVKLYEKANKPKYLWLDEKTNHIGLFYDIKSRKRLVKLLESSF